MYNNILYATDLSKEHYVIDQKAATIAKSFGANLQLIHVLEPPTSLQIAQGLGFAEFDIPVKKEALTVINVLGESLNISPNNQHIEIGSVKNEILKKASALQCDLIIVGSHSPGGFSAFVGSTTHAIVHNARCDVLTIRSPY